MIWDENALLEVQLLIDYCGPTTTERAVNQIKRYIRTRREMRLSDVIGSYEMDEAVLDFDLK